MGAIVDAKSSGSVHEDSADALTRAPLSLVQSEVPSSLGALMSVVPPASCVVVTAHSLDSLASAPLANTR
jgi:hypothetical protein